MSPPILSSVLTLMTYAGSSMTLYKTISDPGGLSYVAGMLTTGMISTFPVLFCCAFRMISVKKKAWSKSSTVTTTWSLKKA